MKHIFLSIVTLLSFTLFGQDKSTPTTAKEFDKLLIGINFSPDMSYRFLRNSSNSELNPEQTINARNDRESPGFGYTTGLNLNYNFSRKFGLELGVQYSKKGYVTEKTVLTYGDQSLRRDFPSNYQLPTTSKYNQDFYYINIPLRAILSLGKKKLLFVTSIGITTSILIKTISESTFEYEDGTSNTSTYSDSHGLNRLNLIPSVSAGIAYQLNKKLKLNVEPTFRYSIIKEQYSPITENLWSAGLNISCYYTLK